MTKKQPPKPQKLNVRLNEQDLTELFEPFDPVKAEFHPPQIKRYPIILAHGIARPDYLLSAFVRKVSNPLTSFNFITERIHYFKGIAKFLRRHGFEAFHSNVSFAAGVEKRSEDLEREVLRILDESGAEKVHIIAHSMGGLDARHMIVNGRIGDRVCTLTTIATPHYGTSVADLALERGADKVIGLLSKIISLEGIYSCSIEACSKFNAEAIEEEAGNDVIYQVYASKQIYKKTFVGFQPSWKIVHANEGDSDGMIPFSSALWTDTLKTSGGLQKQVARNFFPFPADHLDQMGWWNMNEFHKAGLWNVPALRRKHHYESAIKNVYLKIARQAFELANSDW